jgi:hypothetical protein
MEVLVDTKPDEIVRAYGYIVEVPSRQQAWQAAPTQ